jgi:hypothetical protein
MLPVPQVRSVAELRRVVTQLSAAYKADPWGGKVDYTEDPRRVEWCRVNGRLGDLAGLDCDDVAAHSKASLFDLDPHARMWVLISAGPWSHCVCEFQADGKRWIADTNGVNEIPWGEEVKAFVQRSFYPDAAYEDAYAVLYAFADPRRI